MVYLSKNFDNVFKAGEGGFATVYFGVEKGTNECVAIKVMPIPNNELKKSFKNEVKLLKLLHHRNITKLYDARKVRTSEGKFGIFILEKLDMDLLTFLQLRGELKEKDVKKIFQQICLGVHFCHRNGVAHLDLKVDNILVKLTEKNKRKVLEKVQICDFGFATQLKKMKVRKNSLIAISQGRIGTVEYRAPEIHAVAANNTPSTIAPRKADVWSLGVILFSLVTGYFPYAYENCVQVSAIDLSIVNQFTSDDQCYNLLTKMLDEDYSKRPSIYDILSDPWFRSKSNRSISKH